MLLLRRLKRLRERLPFFLRIYTWTETWIAVLTPCYIFPLGGFIVLALLLPAYARAWCAIGVLVAIMFLTMVSVWLTTKPR